MSKIITVAVGSKTVISISTDEDVNVSVMNDLEKPWEKPAEEQLPLRAYPDSTVVDEATYDPDKGEITFDLFDGRDYTVKAEEDDWRSLVNGASAGRLFNRLTRRNKSTV